MYSQPTDQHSTTHRRRKFLGWGCAGLAAAAIGTRVWQPEGAIDPAAMSLPTGKSGPEANEADAPKESSPSLSDRDAYLPHVGSIFQFSPESGEQIPCTLLVVGPEQIQQAPAARFASYSLVFTVAKGHKPGEGIYRLKHEHLPETEFFLTPVGPDKEYLHLEAVISRKIA